eukprot:5037015-Pyramimonas_sp.AAC.1
MARRCLIGRVEFQRVRHEELEVHAEFCKQVPVGKVNLSLRLAPKRVLAHDVLLPSTSFAEPRIPIPEEISRAIL